MNYFTTKDLKVSNLSFQLRAFFWSFQIESVPIHTTAPHLSASSLTRLRQIFIFLMFPTLS